jgi:DNA-binding XRE family transcriptional regulator
MTKTEIKRIREKLSLTQGQAAALVGVHLITWARWEGGALVPSPYKVALIKRFGAAAEHPLCPRDLGVALVQAGPLSVLTLLDLAALPVGQGVRPRQGRADQINRTRSS